MKFITLEHDYNTLDKAKFRQNTNNTKNCVYLFFRDNECLYIGETGVSLYERCYKNTPKHSEKPFFKEANTIHIIMLDDKIDDISRQTIEAVLIQSYRPKYNQKG